MNLRAYSECLWPATPRVLGFALRPLALGHVLLLARLGSPFLASIGAGGSESGVLPERGDLLFALETCSRDPLHPPGARRLWWLNARHCSLRRGEITDASLAFVKYLRAQCAVPRYWQEAEAEGKGTPLFQSINLTLRTEFACTEADALRTPVALAMADCFALWHSRGAVELVDDDDVKAMEELEALWRN